MQPAFKGGEFFRNAKAVGVFLERLELGLVDAGGFTQRLESVVDALGLRHSGVVRGLTAFHHHVDGGVRAHLGLQLVVTRLDEVFRITFLERFDEEASVGHNVFGF